MEGLCEMVALFLLAGAGAAMGAMLGALIANDGIFLGACAGLIASVLLWATVTMVTGHTAPSRLEDEWGAVNGEQ